MTEYLAYFIIYVIILKVAALVAPLLAAAAASPTVDAALQPLFGEGGALLEFLDECLGRTFDDKVSFLYFSHFTART